MNVLLVEDQHLLREGLKLLLHADPNVRVVAEASSGREALDAPPVDIILMDLSLPDMDGTECIRALRARGVATPILVVSMHEASAIVSEALAAGAQGYVLKSAQPEELRKALAEVHAGRGYLQSTLSVGPPREARPGLSSGERELLNRAVRQRDPEQIRAQLGFSERSFTSLLRSLYRKLGVSDLEQAVSVAVRSGFILPDPHP